MNGRGMEKIRRKVRPEMWRRSGPEAGVEVEIDVEVETGIGMWKETEE